MEWTVTSETVATLRAEAARAHPQECCGLLLGHDGAVAHALPARNVAAEPTRHFEIDPRVLIDAHRAARAGGPQIVGYYHSHPVGTAEPSATDRARAAGDGRIWAIVAAGRVGWWRDGPDGFAPVAVAQAADGAAATESYRVVSIQTGKAAPLAKSVERSAIAKQPRSGEIAIGFLGLAGDEQADRVHHGGPDKALHVYPQDHYPFWRKTLPGQALLATPGAFGENLTVDGLREDRACIGDRYRFGTALLEISQGRQPCWKLAHHLEYSKAPALIVDTRRSGWYCRVIEEGQAKPGDAMQLVDRPNPEWSVARVFGLLIAGDHRQERAALTALTACAVLAGDWRDRARQLADRQS